MSDAPQARGFTVLVPEITIEAVEKPSGPLRAGEVEEQGLWGSVRRWVLHDKSIPLEKAAKELQRVEDEVDGLLAGLKDPTTSSYRLKEVQVSVGVSAQGSIAVVTAGVQASLTLVYTR